MEPTLSNLTQALTSNNRGRTAARFLQCMAQKGGSHAAVRYAESQRTWADREQIVQAIKAAIGAMNRDDMEAATSAVSVDLVAAAASLSIPGRMLAAIQQAPFRTRMLLNSVAPNAAFVGEGDAIPVSAIDLEAQGTLEPRKVAGIVVLTQELVRSSNPAAEAFVASELAKATASAISTAFIDVSNAGSGDVRPASIASQGATRVSTGTTVAQINADLQWLAATVAASNDSDMSGCFWVMHPLTLVHLAFLRDSGNTHAFPSAGVRGTLAGMPVIASTACINNNSPAEHQISLVDARDVLLAWSANAVLELSDEASIQMDGAPDNPQTTSSVMTSLWQRNLTGVKATQYANWKLRRSTACATLTDVAY